MKLTGKVSKGRIEWDNPAAWPIAMQEYEGKRVWAEIDILRNRRTDQANRRYWGVLNPLAAHELSKTRDVPLSKEQVHYILVSVFAGCEETELGLAPVRTSLMNTAQFAIFCEKVQAWLADKGLFVPGDDFSKSSAGI